MDANAYWRDNWEPPRKTRARRSGPDTRSPESRAPRNGSAPTHQRGGEPVSELPGVREGLRIVPLMAGCALVVFVLMAIIEMAGIYSSALTGPSPAESLVQPAKPADDGAARAGDGSEAASTPRSQWQAGALPFLYQIDPAWSSVPYASGTIGDAGCGPTCLAMVYIALTGRDDHDPEAMAAFSESHGYLDDNLTSWRFMSEGAAELGLSSHEVPADANRLRAELKAGRPVICSVRPGDFTTKGHFIVLAGVAENGELVIHDPNSPANSARTWDIQRVLDQCRNLWAFERA